ncbi:hypothetical protein, partial [Klebsiella pneumoniae]|uniref:hypothetical protein n=1 Tax=Klebsiella pneumoniae TaxID=573 RepID=UPI001D0E61E1
MANLIAEKTFGRRRRLFRRRSLFQILPAFGERSKTPVSSKFGKLGKLSEPLEFLGRGRRCRRAKTIILSTFYFHVRFRAGLAKEYGVVLVILEETGLVAQLGKGL